MHIFTYGSLMFTAVWTRVVRGRYNHLPGILPGYVRKAVRGEHYPVVLKSSPSEEVSGLVYLDIEASDINRLDVFEGNFYHRCNETILLVDGRLLDAEIYALREAYRHLATDEDWDPERFQREGLEHFIRCYLGFTTVAGHR